MQYVIMKKIKLLDGMGTGTTNPLKILNFGVGVGIELFKDSRILWGWGKLKVWGFVGGKT